MLPQLGAGRNCASRPPAAAPPQPPPTTRHPCRLPPCAAGPGVKNSKFAGGFNACQFGRLSPYYETYFAAINMEQSDEACGRCVAVRGTGNRATGRTVKVKITDFCASCKYGDLDFTTKVSVGGGGMCARVWRVLACVSGRQVGKVTGHNLEKNWLPGASDHFLPC